MATDWCVASNEQAFQHDLIPRLVIRTQGLRLMRPEKSWRPIVTVEVDKHDCHETVLGVDGQNPNLKETFRLWVCFPAVTKR